MAKATAQQEALIDFVIEDKGNAALVARAGTGKTTTIMLAADAIVKHLPHAEFTICAFNKPIAEEVKAKLIKRGYTNWKKHQAATIHSMGLGLVKFHFRLGLNKKMDFIVDNKVRLIVRDLSEKETQRLNREYGDDAANRPRNYIFEYKYQIEQLVKLAKQAAVGYFEDLPISSIDVWADLADHYDVNGFANTNELDCVIKIAQKVYNLSLDDTSTIDFDDMILFPLIKNIQVKYGRDFVILDEAQDLSRARQALAKKFLQRNGRMIVVGDDRQAIYGFSGADAQALQNLIESLKAKVLPLTVTWRCPKKVVELAQSIVPDIVAPETAIEGEVNYTDAMPDDLRPNDAILCRNTAPLIKQAYALIRAGKAVKVEGRDIGKGLVALTNRWRVTTIDAFLKKLEQYRENEVQKAVAKDKDQQALLINDQCDSLVEIAKVCLSRKQTSLDAVRDFISDLFADDVKDVIVLATYHRCKGREWNDVHLLDHERLCPSPYAKKKWQLTQEQNLAYVAFTRAMKSLTFVNLPYEEEE